MIENNSAYRCPYAIIPYIELAVITSLPIRIVSPASEFILVHFPIRKQHSAPPKLRNRPFL